MEDILKQVIALLEGAIEYIKTSLELVKLKAVDRISEVGASIITGMVAAVILVLVVLFASLGLALWFGDLLGKAYLGFFMVGGIYAILLLFAYLFLGKWIKKQIINYLIKKTLN